MHIKEIELYNFRNYEAIKQTFSKKINVIAGDNAQGKTNLLESIFILGLGKSFRNSKDSEMILFGKEEARVKAIYEKDGYERKIELHITEYGKKIWVDGQNIKNYSALLENIYIVVFSPDDLRLIKDEPEKRRRFLDRENCQLFPLYYKSLRDYKKSLRQRNALIKSEKREDAYLDVWDQSLAKNGEKIIEYRTKFIEKLNVLAKEIHSKITDGKEELNLYYEPSATGNYADLLEIFKKNRREDIKRGITTAGPHRDDIYVEIEKKDARRFASQGQQRTAALSMKLAEVEFIKQEKGENPILLLDDVLSELDEKRQRDLLNGMSGVQIFLTTAEIFPKILQDVKGIRTFLVADSKIEKQFDTDN